MNQSASLVVHQYPVVRQFMTPGPHTIGRERSLAAARRVMLAHGVRHLPVLDGGRISGLLAERDLLLVESMPGVDPERVRVEDAMVQDVITAGPDEPLAEVASTMVEHKIGSVVVVDGDRVMGVFTTIDALGALRDLLRAP